MWIATALTSSADQTPAAKTASDRALDWLKNAKPGKSTEWHALRLLLHGNVGKIENEHKQLLSYQNKDGGWPWLIGGKSDALATGLSIYALRSASTPIQAPALQRAAAYLISTQRNDGSWPVPGTKTKAKGKVVETAVYWGTGWATIGLTQMLSHAPR